MMLLVMAPLVTQPAGAAPRGDRDAKPATQRSPARPSPHPAYVEPRLHLPKVGVAALEPFFRRLAMQEKDGADAPLVVIQVGDSHSAGDFLSARLRELFQDQFGAIGRGLLPPGIADRYYNPRLLSVQASPGWSRTQANEPMESGAFGIAGIRQTTSQGGETMLLRSDELDGFDIAYLTLLRRPGGGAITLRAEGMAPSVVSTDAATEAPLWLNMALPSGTREINLETAGNGPVTLLSWGAHRRGKGVLYANFGLIGARVDMLERLSPDVLAMEWQHYRPGLIIAIFGTNEAFGSEAMLAEYEQLFEERLAVLAASAPGAAVLVIGPPDGNRRGVPGAGLVCGQAAPRRVAGRPGARTTGLWVRPPQLDLVSAAQRAVAARRGWLFWDWSAAMGGPCAMHAWTQHATPLGQPDHVHLTQAGYQRSAEQLFEDLMARYTAWRGKHGRPP